MRRPSPGRQKLRWVMIITRCRFDDALADRLLASASQENELFWRLPLAEFHRSQLPSNFAELNNTGSAAYPAGASTAAGFLSHFVELSARLAAYRLLGDLP